jgi:hypothetical protein
MKRKINSLEIIAIISGILFIATAIYFFKAGYAFDGSLKHTFEPGALLLFSLIFFVSSIGENKKSEKIVIIKPNKVNYELTSDENDFIEFFISIAKENKISKEDLENFLYCNIRLLTLNYTLKLGLKIFFIANISATLKKAIERY